MKDKKVPKETPEMRTERLRWSQRLKGLVCKDRTKFQRHLKHKKGTIDGSLSFLYTAFRAVLAALAIIWIACYSAGRLYEATPIWKTDYLQLQKKG